MKDSKSHREFVAGGISSIPRSGIRDFFDIVNQSNDVISLSIGEPDFTAPWHIREAAIFALERGATSYTENRGTIALRNAISEYVAESYGPVYDPASEVLVTVGVSEALDLAFRAVLEPGDEVIYHEPCYVSYSPVISMAGGIPVPAVTNAEHGFRLTGRMLEEKLSARTKVLLLNFPTNPTGAILSEKDIQEICRFVIENDLLLISDEIYSELTYDPGERRSPAAVPDMRERTIFLNGFSKAWAMTGFRTGFACAPPEITEAMMKIHQYTIMCAPVLSQKAAVEALKNGYGDMKTMRSEYMRRRNFMHAALNEMGLSCAMPRGAFYCFPSVTEYGMPSRDFSVELLETEKVACVPGTAFGPSGEGFIRCSFAAGMEEIKEAMQRMKDFVSRKANSGRPC